MKRCGGGGIAGIVSVSWLSWTAPAAYLLLHINKDRLLVILSVQVLALVKPGPAYASVLSLALASLFNGIVQC